MKTPLMIALLLTMTALGVYLYPLYSDAGPVLVAPQPVAQPVTHGQPDSPTTGMNQATQAKPLIDAVFVLDTTGSMGGLLQAAKENIWSIASTMASAEPVPELRLGLVAYRDRGDDYVTRHHPLSADLDVLYAQLMRLQAGGGGDFPESVNQALREALHQMDWHQGEQAYRVIFLVGDAPPQSYDDEPGYQELISLARQRGIHINTIQAGNQAATRVIWQDIAQLAQGDYFQVSHAGNAVAVTTPYDKQLAAMARELDDTRLQYGNAAAQEKARHKAQAVASLEAGSSVVSQARRAEFIASGAGKKSFLGEQELVDDVASGRVELDSLDEALLPEPVRALDKAARKALVQELGERRASLQADMETLAQQRQSYIAKALADKAEVKRDSLDYQVFRSIKSQAEGKGLVYEDAPRL